MAFNKSEGQKPDDNLPENKQMWFFFTRNLMNVHDADELSAADQIGSVKGLHGFQTESSIVINGTIINGKEDLQTGSSFHCQVEFLHFYMQKCKKLLFS